MSLLGGNIELRGVTQKGKNRIKKCGWRWKVLAETTHVLFGPDDEGEWLFITPYGNDQTHPSARWIKRNSDIDFVIVDSY